ncbi:MAG TPA: DMT family transporter [Herpetosiphonaceae bacterium]|nr:DMT family transporter [Herpetosiphonaceae bacterium]
MHSQTRGFLLAMVAALCWSFTGPGIGILLDRYNMAPLTVAFWRDFFVVVLLLPISLRVFGLPSRSALRDFLVVGFICFGVYHALWVYSVQLNGAAVAVILIYTFPAFATLGSWLLWGEQPSRTAIGGLVLAFVGCALVVRIYDPATLRLNWLGILCGIATGLAQAGYALYSRRAAHYHHPWVALTWTMLVGTLALLLTQTPASLVAPGPNPAPWILLIVLAVGPTLMGYLLFNISLRSLRAGVAGTVVMLEAPFATLLAVLLLAEPLAWPQIAGMALVLAGAATPHLLVIGSPRKQNAAA